MVDGEPFVRRRKRIQASMESGVLVLFAAEAKLRNNDVHYAFRQDSDFYYLTGFDEPDAVLVLFASSAGARSVMFVNPRDPEREIWDGKRLGVDGALALGIDAAYPVAELEQRLPELLKDQTRLYCRFGWDKRGDEKIFRALGAARAQARKGAGYPTELVDADTLVHELRRIKEPAEVGLLERAIAISADAHRAAMAAARPGLFEYEVESILRGVFQKGGSERVAYEPIVGSGENATVLHYVHNRRRMEDGDLLLIDAGCEYGYYAADITRTFPVNGRFSAPQREIYELVLDAQLAAVDAARPGATLDDVHRAAVGVICEGLVRLGVLSGSAEQAEEKGSYRPYFMHKTSHYLGMDVHDVGRYFEASKPRPLERGVVITVEPGLYFAREVDGPAARYRGIGVRIEDDVLIEPEGARVLSAAAPKSVRDVERACQAQDAAS
jgi:Xaa-Pro aminopeptidase